MQYLEIGGAERSLIGLLNTIDTDLYEVDLFLYRHSGEYMKLIPTNINLLPENKKYASLLIPIKNVLKKGHYDIALTRLLIIFKSSILNKKIDDNSIFQKIAKATTKLLPSLNHLGNYDLAISFLAPHNIVKDKVRAKKKIAWIHTDYSVINIDAALELPVWNAYDSIVSISENVTNSFLVKFPTLKDKIVEIENILDSGFVKEQAGLLDVSDELNAETTQLKLLSIGRFSHAKNFDNIPEIAKSLKEKGLSFIWFIIGYGGGEALIREKIKEFQMQDYVVILGKKENPYPYIKACDFYIQPSRYEGKAVTVREAQILTKPVVITDFSTSASQLENGVDGLILPMDNHLFASGLYDFFQDKELQYKLVENMNKRDYSNEEEVKKLYNIIN